MPFVFIVEFQVLLTLKANIWMLQMSTRRGSTEVHEFDGFFLGFHARFKVTSVIGHVFRSLFSQIRQQKKKSLFDTTLLTWYNKFQLSLFPVITFKFASFMLVFNVFVLYIIWYSLFVFMLDGACRFLRVSCYLFNRCFFFPPYNFPLSTTWLVIKCHPSEGTSSLSTRGVRGFLRLHLDLLKFRLAGWVSSSRSEPVEPTIPSRTKHGSFDSFGSRVQFH